MGAPEAGGAPADAPVALVLAAGLGKRMHSDLLKVLHPVGGRPMVVRVLEAVRDAGLSRAVVVSGHQGEALRASVLNWARRLEPLDIVWAHQAEQRGTGHAVGEALAVVPAARSALVVAGDTPLIEPGELRALVDQHSARGPAATLLTARMPNPTGYGRILRDAAGRVRAIVEERDASAEQRRLDEIFTLVACFDAGALRAGLARCTPANAQNEIYLTDAIGLLAADGLGVETLTAADAEAVLGVNDRRTLARAEARVRTRTLERLMETGVTIIDPATTYVDDGSVIEPDTVLCPMTTVEDGCAVGPRCVIGPGAHVRASVLGAEVEVWHSVVEGSRVGERCRIGPFSHLRPGSELGAAVEVGNFAEIKNARLGSGSKQHHHSYIGDADLGERVNVGAGVITVNYDGMRKHRTRVGDGAFLGCNANLVAPIEVGTDGFVAAGSTLTAAVPPGALAIARAPQVNKTGWVARRRGAAGTERS